MAGAAQSRSEVGGRMGHNAARPPPLRQMPPTLTRIVVESETVGEWLRLTVNLRTPEIFSWERVFLP